MTFTSVGATVMLLGIAAWLVLEPVSTNATRAGLAAVLAATWIHFAWLARKRRSVFTAVVAPAALAALILVLPGRTIDPSALRRRSVDVLGSYVGAPYVWGGENGLGMDCSGLLWKALVVAEWKEGVATWNPTLLRASLRLWAHDTAARGLKAGYAGRTKPLFEAQSVNALDDSRQLAGDFVVTADGTHTFAFAGDHSWVEADPMVMPVVRSFTVPVESLRWRVFDPP
jgi:hypothetical protein